MPFFIPSSFLQDERDMMVGAQVAHMDVELEMCIQNKGTVKSGDPPSLDSFVHSSELFM